MLTIIVIFWLIRSGLGCFKDCLTDWLRPGKFPVWRLAPRLCLQACWWEWRLAGQFPVSQPARPTDCGRPCGRALVGRSELSVLSCEWTRQLQSTTGCSPSQPSSGPTGLQSSLQNLFDSLSEVKRDRERRVVCCPLERNSGSASVSETTEMICSTCDSQWEREREHQSNYWLRGELSGESYSNNQQRIAGWLIISLILPLSS